MDYHSFYKRSECDRCGSNDLEKFGTLKHIWYQCNECNTVNVVIKNKTFFETPIIKHSLQFLNLLFLKKLNPLLSRVFTNKSTISQTGGIYGKYAEYLRNPKSLVPWEGQAEKWFQTFEELNITYKNKKILFISGGPGVIAKNFSNFAEVYLTEYDQDSVKSIKELLNLSANVFDVNSDRISDVFNTKFDIIFAESMVNYCWNQDAFLSDLKESLRPNGILVINSDVPSLGYILTWQFVDYIPFKFLSLDGFRGALEKHSFKIIKEKRSKYNSLLYRISRPSLKNKLDHIFRAPFWFYYYLKFTISNKNFNRKFWSLNINYILQKKTNKN